VGFVLYQNCGNTRKSPLAGPSDQNRLIVVMAFHSGKSQPGSLQHHHWVKQSDCPDIRVNELVVQNTNSACCCPNSGSPKRRGGKAKKPGYHFRQTSQI